MLKPNSGVKSVNHQEKGGKSVKTTTLVLGCIAMAMLAVAFWRGRDLPAAGLMAAGRTLWRNLPMLLLSFLIAGSVPRQLR